MQKCQENKVDAGKRTSTKRIVSLNTVAAWGSILLSIYTGEAAVVAPSMCMLIAGLLGVYSGTGHLEYRAFVQGRSRSPEQ